MMNTEMDLDMQKQAIMIFMFDPYKGTTNLTAKSVIDYTKVSYIIIHSVSVD